MTVAEKLRALREKAGLTQAAMAERAGLSLGTIRNYEQDLRMPTLPAVVKLARAVGVDCTAFAECSDVTGVATPKKRKKAR